MCVCCLLDLGFASVAVRSRRRLVKSLVTPRLGLGVLMCAFSFCFVLGERLSIFSVTVFGLAGLAEISEWVVNNQPPKNRPTRGFRTSCVNAIAIVEPWTL